MNNQSSKKHFVDVAKRYNRPEPLIEEIEQYAAKLIDAALPVLFSPLHLSLTMGVKLEKYNEVVKNRLGYYEEFNLKKKNGGFRQINAPKGELLNYQRWVKTYILDQLQFPSYLTAYQKGKSIADNARAHAKQPLIIKFDLQDFYGHISQDKVFGMFKILGYGTAIAIDLAKICCMPGLIDGEKETNLAYLPQGAPTSPAISNFAAGRMDRRLLEYAKRTGFNYTRYADDLTFSGPLKSTFHKGMVEQIISDEGFTVNQRKTRFVPSSANQLVTGLNVNHRAVVPKKMRRMVHTHLHNCLRSGPYQNLESIGMSKKMNYNDWLLGHINYIRILHPFEAAKMMEKYNKINWIQ